MEATKHVLILASGGLDSLACFNYYLKTGFELHALWVDYGQAAAEQEFRAVSAISTFYKTPLQRVDVRGIGWHQVGQEDEIIGRNTLLAAIAISNFPVKSGLIAMGIHAGSPYLDCSPSFQVQISELALAISGGIIDLDFPFRKLYKLDIAQYCKFHNVPSQLSYSCTTGTEPPCGQCLSCVERNNIEQIVGLTNRT